MFKSSKCHIAINTRPILMINHGNDSYRFILYVTKKIIRENRFFEKKFQDLSQNTLISLENANFRNHENKVINHIFLIWTYSGHQYMKKNQYLKKNLSKTNKNNLKNKVNLYLCRAKKWGFFEFWDKKFNISIYNSIFLLKIYFRSSLIDWTRFRLIYLCKIPKINKI